MQLLWCACPDCHHVAITLLRCSTLTANVSGLNPPLPLSSCETFKDVCPAMADLADCETNDLCFGDMAAYKIRSATTTSTTTPGDSMNIAILPDANAKASTQLFKSPTNVTGNLIIGTRSCDTPKPHRFLTHPRAQ